MYPVSRKTARFQLLASDSDEDTEDLPRPAPIRRQSYTEFMNTDPIMTALNRGDEYWGDICPPDLSDLPLLPLWVPTVEIPEEALWAQSWSANLEQPFTDVYDCSALSDAEYESAMQWLYSSGWSVEWYTRKAFKAVPDTLPSRVWVPPPAAATHTHAHCCTSKPAKKGVIPRFCSRDDKCKGECCPYEHGDTIPRLNEPCAFGAECGASDPTGRKRSQCLRMHPGETWTAGMVIHRLPPPKTE